MNDECGESQDAGSDTGSGDQRVAARADELLPEEKAAGSDDPETQAEVILDESDERTDDRNAAPGTYLESRTSDEATPPPDAPES